ncbi:MAG TPA: hypothetical protein VNT54_19430 [Solirubrobacteraceae bacterium]|nr:hypothetical protein [Solirubrobacteraceae bacterium]
MDRVSTLRSDTFELLGRMRGSVFTSVEMAFVSDRLQDVANELGAVETTLISGRTD